MIKTKPHSKIPAEFVPASLKWSKVVELAIVVVLFVIGVIWLGGAYPNEDPLWFRPVFDEQPLIIRIHYHGLTRELRPGDPAFAELVAVINSEIVHHAGYQEGLQPRAQSLDYYENRGYSIQLFYPAKVQIHTRQFFPAADRLMIAIEGSYNYIGTPLLFRGTEDSWLPGGLGLKSIDGIRAAVDKVLAGQ